MFRWITDKLTDQSSATSHPLEDTVRQHLPGADDEKIRIVVAIAGLMGTVAYADQEYTEVEELRIRAELGRIEGLGKAGVDAICAVLRKHIVESRPSRPQFTRVSSSRWPIETLRREVLDALLDVAAADDEIVLAETNSLRLTATALGLTQADYNESQERHRGKLAALRLAKA